MEKTESSIHDMMGVKLSTAMSDYRRVYHNLFSAAAALS